jgi:tetratricopeptide (TPR) repeat protein
MRFQIPFLQESILSGKINSKHVRLSTFFFEQKARPSVLLKKLKSFFTKGVLPMRILHNRFAALLAVMCPVMFAAAMAASSNLKKIEMTTSSQPAKDLTLQAVQALESFDFGKAGALAKEAVKADSNFAFGHMLVAVTAPTAQRTPHIEKFKMLSAKASAGEQQYLEAMVFVLDNKAEQALPIFEKLHKDFPGDRRVCMMLGQLHMNGGKYEAALKYFEAANQLDGGTPRAYSFIGNCRLLQDDYAKARESYQAALAKVGPDASPFQPFFGLSFSYLYEGKPELALKNEEEFLARYVRNGSAQNFPPVWIYNNMARIQLEFGNTAEALKLYEKGYETVPGSSLDSTQKIVWHGRLFHGKARTLAKMGKHQEAWQIAEQIKHMIENGGKEAEQYWDSYHYVAGYVKLESGDYAAAAEHLEQADQNDPFHKMLLARANLKLGKKDYALEIYREIAKNTNSNMERALAYPEAKKMVAQLTAN